MAAATSTVCEENFSAFFIDTASRLNKQPYFETNLIPGGCKLTLLIGTLVLVAMVLFTNIGKQKAKVTVRHYVCFLASLTFIGRVTFQMFFFWHRSITWTEVLAEAGFIIPLSLLSLAYGASIVQRKSFNVVDCFGFIVFIVGTYINFMSEYERYVWKLNDENKGHLYTDGLFQYSRHINYFGEILSFFGFAMFCGWWNIWIPIVMGAGMMLFSVPELDFYLNKRYPDEWQVYINEVEFNMIPFVW